MRYKVLGKLVNHAINVARRVVSKYSMANKKCDNIYSGNIYSALIDIPKRAWRSEQRHEWEAYVTADHVRYVCHFVSFVSLTILSLLYPTTFHPIWHDLRRIYGGAISNHNASIAAFVRRGRTRYLRSSRMRWRVGPFRNTRVYCSCTGPCFVWVCDAQHFAWHMQSLQNITTV